MPDLRKRLIRLAWEQPQFRQEVLGLFRQADLHFISNAARKAFDAELLPQIESWGSEQAEVVREHLDLLLDEALREKNGLYQLLIRYKSNDAGDAAFFADLKLVVDEWARGGSALPLPPPQPAAPQPAPQPVQQQPAMAPMPMQPVVMAPMMAPMPVVQQPVPEPTTTTTTITTVKQARKTRKRR